MQVREFELAYLTTHLAFVIGLATFMFAIGLRVWIQFGDVHKKMGRALTLLTLTFVANMVAYFHVSIARYHFGLPGLLVRFLVLYVTSFGAVAVLSLISVCGCFYLSYQTIRDQLTVHGAPSVQLSVQDLPRVPPVTESWRTWQASTKREVKAQ